jgi:hypothetical protein
MYTEKIEYRRPMAVDRGRIKFPGNPWLKGHAIAEAAWTAELTPEGLRFHLHVVSASYDADDRTDDEDEELDSDWKAKAVWNNYHRCSLSSTKWGSSGFLVATPGKPIDVEKLEGKTFTVDPIKGTSIPDDVELDDLAFNIYLLGHDSVTDHKIRFAKRRGPSTYDVTWKARIALTYTGNMKLKHSLTATVPKLKLGKIAIASEVDVKSAKELLASVLVGAQRYTRRGRTFAR